MSRRSEGPVYKSSMLDIKPATGRFTGTRTRSIHQIRAGLVNPEPREGGHDPELTGSENAPMTRSDHFDVGSSEPFWGDDPFKGIPNAHDEDNQPF
jgi:hypothetical protein